MALIKYSQIDNIEAVLNEWWTVPGLPMALQKNLLSVKKSVAEHKATREELRNKLIDENCQRDEDGKPVTAKEVVRHANGLPVVDREGVAVTTTVTKFVDNDKVNALYDELLSITFECGTIAESTIEPYIEKLNITPQKLEIMESIIA